jgi:hypothetical protein
MGILGAEVRTPLGEPWRVGKRPYGPAALSITASCLKGFYLHQAALGVNTELGKSLSRSRLPSRLDRRRSFLGHTTTSLPANPLAPQGPRRRHPKMLDGAARTTSCRPVDLSRSTCGAPAVTLCSSPLHTPRSPCTRNRVLDRSIESTQTRRPGGRTLARLPIVAYWLSRDVDTSP